MTSPVANRLSLALFLVIAGLPLALGVGYALTHSLGLTGIISEGFTTGHWLEVLTSGVLWRALGFSAYVALVSIALAVAGALGVVVYWADDLRRSWLSYIVYLPLTLPAMVVAFFSFQLLSKAGFASRLAFQLGLTSGLEGFPDLVNDNYGIAIIFAHTLMALPFFTIFFAGLYESERLPELKQLSTTLGARPGQITRRVVAPILLRRASATLLLYFIFVMGAYETPLLLGSQSQPMVSVLTIQKLQRFNLQDIPQAYAISVVYTVLVVGLLLVSSSFGSVRPKRFSG